MNRIRSLAAVAMGAVLAAALLAGCSGTTGASGTGDATKLVIAIPNEPDTLDVLTSNPDALISWIGPNIAETLGVRSFSPDEIQPKLATSWKQDSPTQWTITLRQGVTFSDGQPMTAEDAVASINYGNTSGSSMASTYWGSVASAAVDSQYVFHVTTKTPDPAFYRRLPFIYVLPKTELSASQLASNLVGSGPYKLDKWSRGQDVLLSANDSYWGGKPRYRTVDFIVRPESSVRADTIRTGEADVALEMSAENTSGIKVLKTPGSEVAGFYLNTTGQADGSVMTDLRVRQAVNYAIDRNAIAKNLFGGFAALPNGQFNPSTMTGTDPNLRDFPYDPAKAKDLVTQAGATGRTVTIVAPANTWLQSDELAQAVASYINATGLQAKITTVDYNSWLTQHRSHPKGGDAPDLFMAYVGNEFFDSTIKGIPDMTTGSWLIRDPALTALAQKAMAEPDPQARVTDARQAWDYVNDHAYILPIVAPETITAVAGNLTWSPRPDDVIYLNDIQRGGAG